MVVGDVNFRKLNGLLAITKKQPWQLFFLNTVVRQMKNRNTMYDGAAIKRRGTPAKKRFPDLPPFIMPVSVASKNSSHIFFCCTYKINQHAECCFAIRSDHFNKMVREDASNKDILLNHEHKSMTLDTYMDIHKRELLPPLIPLISFFVSKANISFRQVSSSYFQELLLMCIKIGQANPGCDPITLIPNLERRSFRNLFVSFAQDEYQKTFSTYKGKVGTCLTVDGGKHHTRPYLIIAMSNALFDLEPVVVETVRYFKGKTISYSDCLLKITEELSSENIKIAAIITDNLKAQTSAINHSSPNCFQNRSSNPQVKGILWLSCSCHSLALALVDISKSSVYGVYIETIRKAVNFMHLKSVVNFLKIHCPSSSRTRWTGMWECANFFFKNHEKILNSFIGCQEHDTCYDISDDIIHAITYYSVAIYLFLLPLKTLTTMLESENYQACYVYPIIIKALEETKNIVAEFGLPASLAIELCKAVNTRLINSQTGRILSLLYLSTPLGRNDARSGASDNGLTIHGQATAPLDDSKIEFKLSEQDQQNIALIRESGIIHFKEKSEEARNSFKEYKGILINPITGTKTTHTTLEVPSDDEALTIEEINDSVYHSSGTNDNDESHERPLDQYSSEYENSNDDENEESAEFIGEPDWLKDSNVEVRNFRTREDSTSDDETSESNDYDDYYSDYDEDNEVFDAEIELVDKGIITNSFNTIEEIARRKEYSVEKINVLKSEFGRWLTDELSTFSENEWALTEGLKFWEYQSAQEKDNVYARFILPLFGVVASEALVERCFWYQRRFLGDVAMGIKPEVEKARLNLALKTRK